MAKAADRTSSGGGGAARKDIEVRSVFPTPVVIARPPMSDADNRKLCETVLAREKTDKGVMHSNLSGWQSQDDFTDWSGEEGDKLIAFARALADKLTGNRAGQQVEVPWFVNAWANVNRDGHANQVHAHPGCVWSGTYYADDGGIAGGDRLGGAFEIMDPRGLAPAMYAPELAPTLSGCQSMGGSELIAPETGMMILFPAWLQHGVRPYRGKRTRISIAFNFAMASGGS